MPDRPRNGGPEDGPDFTWLYGEGGKPKDPQATRPVPRQERPCAPPPDATRMMPTQPRPGTRRAARRPHPASVAPPVAPPAAAARPAAAPPVPAPLRLPRPAGLARLHRRGADPVLDQHREGRVRARGRPAVGPAGHDLPPRRQRLPRGPDQGGAQGAQHRQRRRRPHRHDHAAAHRLGPQPAALDPPGLDRRHPRPRHEGKINAAYAFGGPELLVETIEERPASGSTSTSRSGWAAWPASSTRWAASRSARRRNMVDKLAGLDIKKGCQEVDGATALAYARSRHTSGSATSTGYAASARWSPRSARGALAVDGHQPGPLVAAQPRDPRVLRLRRGHGPVSAGSGPPR